MSATELAVRNRTDFEANGECAVKSQAKHILDADCIYENDTFALFSLPCKLPNLFTVRFTAPADYSPASKITLKGEEFAIMNQNMQVASEGLFSAGAVVQCDVDMQRNLAFFVNAGSGATGSLPDMSFEEQYAGYHDLEGRKVYVKSVDMGQLCNRTAKHVPHNIPNFYM